MTTHDLSNPILNSPYEPPAAHFELGDHGPTGEVLHKVHAPRDARESFFVRRCCYFTGNQKPYERLRKAPKYEIDEDAWAELYGATSRLFARPESGRIAVKVINDYGDEVLKVFDV